MKVNIITLEKEKLEFEFDGEFADAVSIFSFLEEKLKLECYRMRISCEGKILGEEDKLVCCYFIILFNIFGNC